MAELFHVEDEPQYICWDRKNYNNAEEQLTALKNSKTVYVGNLSFFTKEEQIHETFAAVGPVKRVIMGLNSFTKQPCGFCFVEFYTKEHANAALKYLSDTVCDDRLIRCDADGGFIQGRQYGRGRSGGQIRDEMKDDYDPGRGRYVMPGIYDNRKDGGRNDRYVSSSRRDEERSDRFVSSSYRDDNRRTNHHAHRKVYKNDSNYKYRRNHY